MAASKKTKAAPKTKARNLPPNLGSRREARRKVRACTRCETKTTTVYRIEKGEDANGATTRTRVKAGFSADLARKSLLCASCAEKRIVELERYDSRPGSTAPKKAAKKAATKAAKKTGAKRATKKTETVAARRRRLGKESAAKG